MTKCHKYKLIIKLAPIYPLAISIEVYMTMEFISEATVYKQIMSCKAINVVKTIGSSHMASFQIHITILSKSRGR